MLGVGEAALGQSQYESQTLQAEKLAEHCRRLEADLRRLERELDHSQRLASLGMVLGIIAHEFNNILTPILSYAQLALDNPADAALTAKALRRAADGSEKAARIASSVLALARKDGYVGNDESHTPRADVLYCIKESLHCLAIENDADGIQLVVDVAPGSFAAIDQVALQQILINLILNAKKALRSRQGRIAIRATATRADSRSTRNTTEAGAVVIEVEDTGRGIAPDVLCQIFEPFVSDFPVRDPLSQTTPGTGLGLTICKRLIEAAGGRITANSTVGEGSLFQITLPAADLEIAQKVA